MASEHLLGLSRVFMHNAQPCRWIESFPCILISVTPFPILGSTTIDSTAMHARTNPMLMPLFHIDGRTVRKARVPRTEEFPRLVAPLNILRSARNVGQLTIGRWRWRCSWLICWWWRDCGPRLDVGVSVVRGHGDGQSGRAHACMVRAWATYVTWAQRA